MTHDGGSLFAQSIAQLERRGILQSKVLDAVAEPVLEVLGARDRLCALRDFILVPPGPDSPERYLYRGLSRRQCAMLLHRRGAIAKGCRGEDIPTLFLQLMGCKLGTRHTGF